MTAIAFDNTYARQLEGFHVPWKPATAPAPRLLYANTALAAELGLDPALLQGPQAAATWAGNQLPEGAEPIAQAYAGHQFGGFSPQLGDGRALLLGEVMDTSGRRRDIAFKGSGRTPFSRGGDGKAAVGPMLREVLIGEAMHALGIPTTRALAVVATGERVMRELPLPGAVLTRVAASHLRVGTFQFYAARGDLARLRQLTDYTIHRHDPALAGRPDAPLALLQAVAQRQARLIAQWMNVGFIHGVMNTDNMALSGETIDYGPCAFMEAYNPAAVFSSIDHGGRYAYANQPHIARWNLARFAETLLPLIAGSEEEADTQRAVEQAMAVIDGFPALYEAALLDGQRAKLGLVAGSGDDAQDRQLAADWLALLEAQAVDFTLGWRRLADAAEGREQALLALFTDAAPLQAWLQRWRQRADLPLAQDGVVSEATTQRAAAMRRASPFVIPRNHRVEEALTAATMDDDLQPFQRLLAALQQPFSETPELLPYGQPAPAAVTACYQTFCGT
ncbi:protein adenylyltransferase SelO [uncultured Aquincola sp.]|uniref:protein adenylyltransferase SelO n=1 Tax=uncultured Aquincola sp. TaxID=886556 RepID=UPI0032B296A0